MVHLGGCSILLYAFSWIFSAEWILVLLNQPLRFLMWSARDSLSWISWEVSGRPKRLLGGLWAAVNIEVVGVLGFHLYFF